MLQNKIKCCEFLICLLKGPVIIHGTFSCVDADKIILINVILKADKEADKKKKPPKGWAS